jgi:uncharacterized membrane protein YhaH (DUF805 family)
VHALRYNGYAREYYWWETLVGVRKLALISVAVFLIEIGAMTQCITALICVFVAFHLQVPTSPHTKPFKHLSLSGLWFVLNLCCAAGQVFPRTKPASEPA